MQSVPGHRAELGPQITDRRIAGAVVRAILPGHAPLPFLGVHVPSTVEQLSPTRVKITVEVPFTDLKPSMDKAYRQIAKSVNIPGFRQGKVPPMVIDQRFGRGVVIQEAFNESWQDFYSAAVVENKLRPLAQPDLEVTKLEDGDLIEFTAEVDIRPDFVLPDFSSIAVTVDAVDVPDSLVDGQLDLLRNRFGSRETVERPAHAGDVVTINLVAKQDGELLADGTAENQEYVIGSGKMLEGLDDAVTGLSAGESATFTSTLVGGPAKDEEAEIEVTVTKVQQQELPDIDDDFAQQASPFDTVEEMRADVAQQLSMSARGEQASIARDLVLGAVIEKVDVELPANTLAAEYQARRDQITNQLAGAQLDLAAYLEEAEEGKTEEEFWAEIKSRAAQTLKAQLVLDKVAEENGVSVDQNDLTQHIIARARQEGSSPQQVADHLKEHPHHIDEYMLEIRRSKALDFIVEQAAVTDTNGEPVDLALPSADGDGTDPKGDAADVAAESPAPAAESTATEESAGR
jgi:trigger factor